MQNASPDLSVPAGDPEVERRSRAAWRRARIQIGVILTIGICVVALLWLIMIVVIESERRAAVDHARGEANNLSAALQEELSQTLDTVSRAMDAVALRMRAAQGPFDVHEWAKDIPLLAAAAIQCAIIGPDGMMVSTTLEAHPAPVDLSDREHFRVPRDGIVKGVFISKPVRGRVSGKDVIQVSRRVDSADGKFLGVIVFSLAPNQLTTLHQTIDLGEHGRLIVTGTYDNVIRARFGTGNETNDVGVGERVPALPRSDSGTPQSFIRESVIDHLQRLYSVRYLDNYPLRVAVALDLTEIMQPVVVQAWWILAIGVMATLMMACMMTLLVLEIRRRTNHEVQLGDEQDRLAAEIEQGTQVQEQLRASAARLRDFARMASDWFWEQDTNLNFTEIGIESPSLAAGDRSHLGKPRWEMSGTNLTQEQWARHKEDLAARKPFRDFRYSRIVGKKLRHFSINGAPVFDGAGGFLGYRGTGRDTTAEMEAAAELLRSKDLAEASDRAKSVFLTNMSHELRTPLNAIIGFSELLHGQKSGSITDEYVEWSGDILASGLHLLDVINDLLELSRVEAGRYDLEDEIIDLGNIVRACLPMVRRQAETNQVRIACAIGEGTAMLRADRRAIKQIILNLVTNAVKFSPGGGEVSIRAESTSAGGLSLVVADTGIGIDPEVLPKLCNPFIQADASTSRKYGGTGLGLAISGKLAELHGGTLTIASALGKGTTVRVTFPSARVQTEQRRASESV